MGKVVGLTFESSAPKRIVDSKKSDTSSISRTSSKNAASQSATPPETENNGGDE